MHARFHEWRQPALELIAPPECAGCGLTGSGWCGDCRERTVRIQGDVCPVCGGPRPGGACSQCAEYQAVFAQARSFAEYRLPFRRLVIRLKYSPDRTLGETAARLAHDALGDFLRNADLAVPVPLGSKRLNRRGYNQVDLFGRPLAVRMGAPYRPEALRRVRETRSQVGLTVDQRASNLEGAFEADRGLVTAKRVLLLDDVFTSGSTGNACARALYAAGAAEVRVFTLARALPGQDD